MADHRFFSTTKKGEIHEFKQDLNSLDRGKKKDAVKKVIAAMTVGKDVSSLFPDVVNCMQTDDMELKKLVYLYLINYAKTQPDLAIMAVNTFVKARRARGERMCACVVVARWRGGDSQDPNPLIRALAVRTMGCIRVDKITEYLCDPLQRCLKDEDPYVRKTAAVCVAKLFDISPELVEDRGFLDALRDMIGDANPMVVANAVAALSEMQASSPRPVFRIDPTSLFKLLRALNECTEWGQARGGGGGPGAAGARGAAGPGAAAPAPGSRRPGRPGRASSLHPARPSAAHLAHPPSEPPSVSPPHPPQVFILDSLAHYTPADAKDAESIVERVSPRLQHANSAVVLSAVKVILANMQAISDEPALGALAKRLAPPLVTLLGSEPEIQYVALRNISLIVQRYPAILAHEVKVFFCKYNDPIYVKMEKLEIMIRLANERNIDQVLLEFKEYATEVDVDFVRRAVRAIGRCAVSIEKAAERCINVLLELIQTKVNYVVQEAIIVIKDIFRWGAGARGRGPAGRGGAGSSMGVGAASAGQWAAGRALLEQFLESFPEETPGVQLQLVTATVKLFLKRPTEKPQQLIQLETDNPDLRDRAYIYWRLLSTDPEAAKEVVLAEKPVISDVQELLDPSLLDGLLRELGTLASVYHKPPSAFVSAARLAVQRAEDLAGRAHGGTSADEEGSAASLSAEVPSAKAAAAPAPDLLGDLLDLGEALPAAAPPPAAAPAPAAAPPPAAAPAPAAAAALDLLGVPPTAAPAAPPAAALPVLATHQGLTISGRVAREGGQPLAFQNAGPDPLDGFMIQLNKNALGLAPTDQAIPVGVVPPGTRQEATVQLVQRPDMLPPGPSAQPAQLQAAIKTAQLGVAYLSDVLPLSAVLLEGLHLEPAAFVETWRATPEAAEQQAELGGAVGSVDAARAGLSAAGFEVLAHKAAGGEEILYVAGQAALPGVPALLLLELRFVLRAPGVRAFYRGARPELGPLLFAALPPALAAA
eukprot:scaffold1.g5532.t1